MTPGSHSRERRSWRAVHPALALAMTLSLIALAVGVVPVLAGFGAPGTFATGESPTIVAAADLNGDGKLDLAVANLHDNNTISVLLNTTPARASVPSFAPQEKFAVGFTPSSVTAADLNGDGKPDLAVTNSSHNTVSVLLNTTSTGGVPSFAPQQVFDAGSSPASIAAADVNGDGKPDLAMANHGNTNTVSLLLNTTETGASVLTFSARYGFATGAAPRFAVAADLNGDGKPDLAVTNNHGASVSVLLNGTAPGATVPAFWPQQQFEIGTFPVGVATADLNGDGKLDLAVANNLGPDVGVLLNTTATGAEVPTFTMRKKFAAGPNPVAVATADLNGDGKPDLAVGGLGRDYVTVLLNTTANGAAVPTFAELQTSPARGDQMSVAAADLNGDGRPDIAAANYFNDTVSILLGNPSGIIQFSSVSFIAAEDAGSATITLTRTGSTDGQVSAIVSLTGGSATQGQDFAFASPQTVTWADGDGGNKSLTIPITQDAIQEGSEAALFSLTLPANPFGATLGAQSSTTLSITETNSPVVSIENGDRSEGNAGTEQIPLFRVSLTPPHTQTVTVQYATSDGTATAGKDYVATSGTLTFAPGETTRFVTVQVFGDLLDEPDETFQVTLANPTQASLGVAQATGRIHNDDTPGTCTPRPRINVQVAANGNALQVHVEPTPPHTGAANRLQQLRFGNFQNATVTLNGQPVTSGQSVLMPTNSQAADFVVTRVAAGQPATVPLTVVDGCGEWQTFVGGGAGAGF